jgi:hypothetical protein
MKNYSCIDSKNIAGETPALPVANHWTPFAAEQLDSVMDRKEVARPINLKGRQ